MQGSHKLVNAKSQDSNLVIQLPGLSSQHWSLVMVAANLSLHVVVWTLHTIREKGRILEYEGL